MSIHPSTNTGSSRKNWQYSMPAPVQPTNRGYLALVAALTVALPVIYFILTHSS